MSLLARRLKTTNQLPEVKRVEPLTNTSYQFINGRLVAYEDNINNYIVKGYDFNDILYSIVRLIVNKAKTAPFGLYKIEDEQAYKQYISLIQNKDFNIRKVEKIKTKALTPVKDPGKWGDLLKYPNDEQEMCDLVEEAISFCLMTGNSFISGRPLKAGANSGIPNEIRCEPSQWMNILTNGKWPVRKVGYELSLQPDVKFLPSEMIHYKYPNLKYDINGNQLYGQSPVKAGLRRLQKNNLQQTAEASAWGNEGIKGVFAFKVQPGQVDGETVQNNIVQPFTEQMRTQWQGAQNRGKMGTSGYDLSWIPVGLNAEEMELIESGWVDLRMMCNWFGGVPSQLLNDPTNKHYNNYKEGQKALTSSCAIPELYKFRNAFNRQAQTHWTLPKNYVGDFDLSVYPELQADVKETAEWTGKLIAISPNEQRELCGLAALPDEEMNEPWVLAMGRTPAKDFHANVVDNALNDDNGDEGTDA